MGGRRWKFGRERGERIWKRGKKIKTHFGLGFFWTNISFKSVWRKFLSFFLGELTSKNADELRIGVLLRSITLNYTTSLLHF